MTLQSVRINRHFTSQHTESLGNTFSLLYYCWKESACVRVSHVSVDFMNNFCCVLVCVNLIKRAAYHLDHLLKLSSTQY